VFQIGAFKIRLCRQHLAMLSESIARRFVADRTTRSPDPR
jgi:hypothetical protein